MKPSEFAFIALLALAAGIGHAAPEMRPLMQWDFAEKDVLRQWKRCNHVTDLRIENGALCGRITDWDPFVIAPQFEIPATPWQVVEVRMRLDCGGQAQLFWTHTTQSKYGGFSPEKHTNFDVSGGGEWRTYRVRPFWHREGKIILLRLDFPGVRDKQGPPCTFAIDFIRILDPGQPKASDASGDWDFTRGAAGWQAEGGRVAMTAQGARLATGDDPQAKLVSGPLQVSLDERLWLHVRMQVDRGGAGYVHWVSDAAMGMHSAKFPLRTDGRRHSYNVDMGPYSGWNGHALLLELQPTDARHATALVQRVAVSDKPLGPPDVVANYFGPEDAINRAGRPAKLWLQLDNIGGEPARGLSIARLDLPAGVIVTQQGKWRTLPELQPFEPRDLRLSIRADRPVEGSIRVTLAGPGAPAEPITGRLQITPDLHLPRADYVPRPQPVPCDYEIGAFYFPGWPSMVRWEPIRRRGPVRKPVLGWYDEGNPECVDWQIKWAVEHGITWFLVDWYWNKGNRSLEHWVKAFYKARYRRYLKWCVMWANHIPPGSHSMDDMRAVAKYWVDNYFLTPEYYRIEDMPVVVIWSPQNIRRDLGGSDGARAGLEAAQQVARAAGLKGIYFTAMKWPEASTDPATIQRLAAEGYRMTSIYHYMHHGGKAEDPRHFPFQLVADSSYEFWQKWRAAGALPFLPNLSTGWDSRPWHGDRSTVIYGRTPELFRRICEDARRFAGETGIRRLALGPLNEWGEGSYAEPCKEFGFAMYDAVRDVFCRRPAGGWPPNIAPVDVGLGPYDLPAVVGKRIERWTFDRDAGGWGAFMGVTDFHVESGAAHFRTTSHDPAIGVSLYDTRARDFAAVRIRMRIDAVAEPGESAQLFWSTATSQVSEANSLRLPLIGDGQFHDYLFPVGDSGRWRGSLRTFRFDPCSHSGAKVTIDEVALVRAEE